MAVPNYDRTTVDEYREIDRWDGGLGWLVHPTETGRRASHAVRGDDGVWLFDPLDAPGIDDLIAEVGDVAGVAVLSNWHARDAGAIARRHDVAVHLPEWMTRVEDRVEAPIGRYTETVGDSGFRVRRCQPMPGWREGIAVRETDGTLYVPESLGTAPAYTVGGERLGCPPIRRFSPPRSLLADVDPRRVLVGHGTGVFEGAAEALDNALAGARRRLPRALLVHGPTQLRALFEAAR